VVGLEYNDRYDVMLDGRNDFLCCKSDIFRWLVFIEACIWFAISCVSLMCMFSRTVLSLFKCALCVPYHYTCPGTDTYRKDVCSVRSLD
jgi:hypothetical protein